MTDQAVKNRADKSAGPAKTFMTVGPTLHYSHNNVKRYWGLSILIYSAVCLFWSKILTGTALSIEPFTFHEFSEWGLGRFVDNPLSIYQYPWQMVVLALTMGIMAIVPLLASQLMSYRHSLPHLIILVLITRLGLFGFVLLIGCIAVACRPLRFRSRFISIMLCMAPVILYWAFLGNSHSYDPVRWGFSFAPWIGAWITSLGIAGIVLGIGHFTRYRPGLLWGVSLGFLLISAGIFQSQISFAELDYQLYVAGNNPEEVPEFHDHNMTPVINRAMDDPSTKQFLAGFFYPTDREKLRAELISDIQIQLGYDRWPSWFNVPENLRFQSKRLWLLEQYNLFIENRTGSGRMPIALYYKAVLKEMAPDIPALGETEILRFHSDYPHHENRPIWFKLYNDYPQSPESFEARRRMAIHLAGQGEFDRARELCEVALVMLDNLLEEISSEEPVRDKLLAVFRKPPDTVMTELKLNEVRRRIVKVLHLLEENLTDDVQSRERLAMFMILNPYSLNYRSEIEKLLAKTPQESLLRDNLLLAQAMLDFDLPERAQKLSKLHNDFPQSDGGIEALYELGVVYSQLWRETEQSELKELLLEKTRRAFNKFLSLYPQSIYTEHILERRSFLPEN